MIFEKSLRDNILPNYWKFANVTVIYKKGPKHIPGNYRPVSLTSQVCKLLEGIIKDQIVEHLNKFKLITDSQHGFIKNQSCLTNLLEFMSFVIGFAHKGKPVDVIYLYFQKAFDKVPLTRGIYELPYPILSENLNILHLPVCLCQPNH